MSRVDNPAVLEALLAQEQIHSCIKARQNFKVEAGAGAGKTTALVNALNFTLSLYQAVFKRRQQQVACITYTNIAAKVITERTGSHSCIFASTIHGFAWSLIKDFQLQMREALSSVGKWSERLRDVEDDISYRTIDYNLGYPRVEPDGETLSLGHDDVIEMFAIMLTKPKFRTVLTMRYPVIFIDEYQDTGESLADAILEQFIETQSGPLIGLFGDSWQQIYRNVCGLVEHENLVEIRLGANFRSDARIVTVLNRIRKGLQQVPRNSTEDGSAVVYHSNNWSGVRRGGSHWKGDLPEEVATRCLQEMKVQLQTEGWDFKSDQTKILVLTHNALAGYQNYRDLSAAFKRSDDYIKKENPYIKYLVEVVEPLCRAYADRRYGDMLTITGLGNAQIRSIGDKEAWRNFMEGLLERRSSETIGSVLDYLKMSDRVPVPEKVQWTEAELEEFSSDGIARPEYLQDVVELREVSYQQVVALTDFISHHTPFSTKHGVKGDEFNDVLVVLGRGWNEYNWGNFLEWETLGIPAGRQDAYVRARNLFYVVTSRAKKRLVLLFTQELSRPALETLHDWFGVDYVKPTQSLQ